MDLGKFNNLSELIDSINLGLDIEFYLFEIRYNISPGDDEYFICECPNGNAVYYKNGLDMVNNYKINDKLLKDLWSDIGLYSM
ncbi:hypothetical protein [Clostridium sp.]|uniref:hypothetical protein n=1 Tax=Clostridium sp. TaxID=1506 RepID=UPI0025BA6CB2|nr:hypothetical protein [Clostridium sp.]MCI9304492.1 hypothetical protein [Clostridium sp.]